MLDCTSNKSNLPEKYNRERVGGGVGAAEDATTRTGHKKVKEPVKRVARWVDPNGSLWKYELRLGSPSVSRGFAVKNLPAADGEECALRMVKNGFSRSEEELRSGEERAYGAWGGGREPSSFNIQH